MSSNAPSWTSILHSIIKSTAERQRIANELSIAPMTLTRWANGETKPHKQHLVRLLQAVPVKDRQELFQALEQQYPDLHAWLIEDTVDTIPSEFFAQVLHMRTITNERLLFWRLADLILKQALEQLDPNRLGLSIRLVQCMPPREDGAIHSLREIAGKGHFPWPSDLEHEICFLGGETLCGYVVETGYLQLVSDLRHEHPPFPVYHDKFEVSAVAHPIRYAGLTAGCLLAASSQPHYFTPLRVELAKHFSDLLALAFPKSAFHANEVIKLHIMPEPEKQYALINTYRERTARLAQQAAQEHLPFDNTQTSIHVWQQIEGELLATR
ncbi:GAF domain-containing protein [Ktedonobacter racemifer]|uniref:GAF domain protein n=1 Tax=Ktedonobacter racemifer DSM 44963 TaxID=485913 RepID=D6TK98_KTERA|nr:GAF domain-containing protein [Ktedonobacter racemifer]EFH86198.1 GAF domain protein [Ktedonobacter racemifer DSM 44963]